MGFVKDKFNYNKWGKLKISAHLRAKNIPAEITTVLNSAKIKRSPAEWALRYVWNEPGISGLLSGMNSIEQVEENIRVANGGIPESLSREELLMFDTLRNVMNTRIKVDCTACRYCMPCSSGVDIPHVLDAINIASFWNDPNPWLTGYFNINGKAGKCTSCRECEEICPQELPISTLMKEAVSLFKE